MYYYKKILSGDDNEKENIMPLKRLLLQFEQVPSSYAQSLSL